MKGHFLLLSILCFSSVLFCQSSSVVDGRYTTPATFFQQYQERLNLSTKDDMVAKATINSPNQWKRHRYTQTHLGFTVIGHEIILHEQNGILKKYSGSVATDISITEDYKITKKDIGEICSQAFGKPYSLAVSDTVIVDKAFPSESKQYALAYEVIASGDNADAPFKQKLYIDTQSGAVLYNSSLVKYDSELTTVETRYYDSQEITTELVETATSNYYVLRDYTRGNGVITLNGNDRVSGVEYSYADFKSTDNSWERDDDWENEAAVDAHYCAEKYYDYMSERFGYSGLDGEGSELVCVTNTNGKYYVNAYWNGSYTHYGNGDCANYDPLTTLDVVGHEFTHGFTDYTSDLVYKDESGALNEAMSDIFGKALEFQYDFNNFDWLIGSRFRENEEVNVFRSMSNPNDRNDPKYYGGKYWYVGTGDNGGVHSNSGALNYWFYLLCEGGNIVNEQEQSFSIIPIGIDKAMDVVFSMQAGYLTVNSNYIDAMYASLEVAEDLYGSASVEYNTILDAWAAVGLFPGFDAVDLSLVFHEDHSRSYCANESASMIVTIYNNGTEVYPNTSITLYSEFEPLQPYLSDAFELPVPFMPGDSINIAFDDIIVEKETQHQIFVSIVNDDFNQLNNSNFEYLYHFEESIIDLELIDFSFNYGSPCNQNSIESYSYRIRNNGCTGIPADSTFYIDLYASDGSVSTVETINFSIFNSRSTRASTRYIDSEDDIVKDFVLARLRYVNDQNTDNNTIEKEANEVIIVEKGYYEGFDDASNLDFDISGSIYVSQHNVIPYQGNSVLAIKGRSNPSSFINCPDEEDFFEYNYQKKSLSFCVDASDLHNPTFSFRSLSIANQTEDIPDANYRTLILLSVDGEEELISDLPFDSYVLHTIHLDQGFTGLIEVTAFVLSGNGIEFTEVGDDADYLLFDDFELSELSSADDFEAQQGFIAFPNPTSNQLRIEDINGTESFELAVYNSIGQMVLAREHLSYIYNLDTSQFLEGVYYASISRNGKVVTSLKFQKTN